jgi:hypothetical protein
MRGVQRLVERATVGVDGSVAQRIGSVLAGLTVGTLVVWLLPFGDGWPSLIVLVVGGALLGAVFRQWVGLAGVGLALFVWIQTLWPRFGIDGPEPAGSSFNLGVAMFYVALVFGVLVAAIAYAVSLLFRGPTAQMSGRRPMRLLGMTTGLISAAAIGVAAVAIAPADTSFGFALPTGWSSVKAAHSAYFSTAPMYCNDYVAGTGLGVLAGNGPESLTVPTLCATVVKFPYQLLDPYGSYTGSQACYYVLANGGGGEGDMTDWVERSKPSSPPIAGSYEEVRAGPQGGVIYGLGLERWRHVGPFLEHLCYVVALTVPNGSSLSPASVNAILGTFSFR